MKRLAVCALLLALIASSPAEANIFQSFGDAWQSVSGAVSDAFNTVVDSVRNAAQWTECKAVDWATFDMDPCWAAPEDNLCPDDCKSNLEKLPQICLDRLVTQVADQGNATITDRLEAQIEACGMNYTLLTNGGTAAFKSLIVPVVVILFSTAMMMLLGP